MSTTGLNSSRIVLIDMSNIAPNSVIQTTFDLFRLSKSKSVVDVCPNTLRAYAERGLPIYKQGKAAFVSKEELTHFIRTQAMAKN